MAQQGRYPLTIFFDGDCPICAREIMVMKKLNRHGRLHFMDFASSSYNQGVAGLDPAELARVIHAQWADGRVITGVEVFRASWTAIGLGLVARLSRLPILDGLIGKAYGWFARNRLWLTGRAKACGVKKTGSDEWPDGSPCRVKS